MRAKKLAALLLCAVLLLGIFPVSSLAADSNPFKDVKAADWFYDGVQYAYAHGMMTGTGNGKFSPNVTTTRGMIVTILHRLEGTPKANGTKFSDVADGKWYADAVRWASSNGIVNGYGGGRFGPEDTITREQMASILYRYAGFKGYDVSAHTSLAKYTDTARISTYAVETMTWANAVELITGTSATTLSPRGSATRAQAAVILMRFCERIAKSGADPETEEELIRLAALNGGTVPFISCDDNGVPNFIHGKTTDKKVKSGADAIASLAEISHLMQMKQPSEEFKTVDSATLYQAGGARAYRLQQVYRGVPVYGCQLVVSTDSGGVTTALSGHYLPNLSVNTTPGISETKAKNLVGTDCRSEGLQIRVDDSGRPVLCWVISTDEKQYLIDANSGEILSCRSTLIAETVTGSGNRHIRSNGSILSAPVTFSVNLENRVYSLYDSTRNIRVTDANHTDDRVGTPVSETSNTNWAAYPEAVTVYTNAARVYDFYKNTLGRDGADNKHKEWCIVINFNSDNDPTTPLSNAYFSGGITDKTAVFLGDGNDYYVSLDALCHEFTHAVTNATWDGYYEGESGALNEAYSDIIGDLFEDGRLELHGEDLASGAIRSFADPASRNQPAHYNNLEVCPNAGHHSYIGRDPLDHNCDYNYVHSNSGIINHAAYLMDQNWPTADHANELALLFYNSMAHLSAHSTFLDCRHAVLTTAGEMNMSAEKRQTIADAFSDVGVGLKDEEFWASVHHIKARILDAVTGKPIIDAMITAISADEKSGGIGYPDVNGYVDLKVSKGTYKVSVFADDYRHWETDNVDLTSITSLTRDLGTISLTPISNSWQWKTAYQKMVCDKLYLNDGAEMYFTDEEHSFALYDMNRDGIPELLISCGSGIRANRNSNVYTYADGAVKSVGFFPNYLTGVYAPTNEAHPGLFVQAVGTNGFSGYFHYTMKDNQLESELVMTHDMRTSNAPYEQKTSDAALYQECLNVFQSSANHVSIPSYTLRQINTMGWEAFVNTAG